MDKTLILLNQTAASREEIIGRLAKAMEDAGYVGPTYGEAAIERERDYPTGLPCEGVAVAIPHALSDDVMKTGVAAAVMAEPVEFVNMGDEDDILPVEIVILMANAEGGGSHMDDLQELMGIFSRPELLIKLRNAETAEEFAYYFDHPELFAEEE